MCTPGRMCIVQARKVPVCCFHCAADGERVTAATTARGDHPCILQRVIQRLRRQRRPAGGLESSVRRHAQDSSASLSLMQVLQPRPADPLRGIPARSTPVLGSCLLLRRPVQHAVRTRFARSSSAPASDPALAPRGRFGDAAAPATAEATASSASDDRSDVRTEDTDDTDTLSSL